MNQKIILISLFLLSGYFALQAQTPHEVSFSELTAEDIDFIFKESGKLYLSQKGYSIDHMIKVGNHKFTTSRKYMNEIRIFDDQNLLIQKLSIKPTAPRQILEIYRVGDEVYAVFRATNKKTYRLTQRNNGEYKIKTVKSVAKNKSAYFNKTIPLADKEFLVSDYTGPPRGNPVESTVMMNDPEKKQMDTLAVIKRPGDLMVLQQPFSSWTYDITEGANAQNVFVHNTQSNLGLVVDKAGKISAKFSVSDLIKKHDLASIKSFLMGRYHYYVRIITDYEQEKTYLYTGGLDEQNEAHGILFEWETSRLEWEKVDFITETETFPFLNLREIEGGIVYFLIKDDQGANSVYKKELVQSDPIKK